MREDQLQTLQHFIKRLEVAITNLVTTSAQFVRDTQTITGTSMVLANTPTFIFSVSYNGQEIFLTTDYSIVGATITFVNTMAADTISVVYKY